MQPSPGDLLIVDGRASVQFAGDRALILRVVSVYDRPTYHGWVWLTGYVVNRRGRATDKREVYVQLAGLRRPPAADAPAQPTVRCRLSRRVPASSPAPGIRRW